MKAYVALANLAMAIIEYERRIGRLSEVCCGLRKLASASKYASLASVAPDERSRGVVDESVTKVLRAPCKGKDARGIRDI